MRSFKALQTKNEDTPSSSQQAPPNDSLYRNDAEYLAPISDNELDFWNSGFTSLNHISPVDETLPYYRGTVEKEVPIENPFNTMTMMPFSVEKIHQREFALQDVDVFSSDQWIEAIQDDCSRECPLQNDEAGNIWSETCQMNPCDSSGMHSDSIMNDAFPLPFATTTSDLVISPANANAYSNANANANTNANAYINAYANANANANVNANPYANANDCADANANANANANGNGNGNDNDGTISIIQELLIKQYCPFSSPSPASHHLDQQIISPHVENSQNLNQFESEKKRRPKANGTDTGVTKGCNCKKSSCTKLYCKCFDGERFCKDTCNCEGCTNKPEYADRVNSAKEKIKSHNSSAFVPKIVENGTHIPSNNMENGNLKTLSSAKHRKGCGCSKSKCDKRYCECYAGNVGCCSECRCEGCQNSFGRKGG